MKKITDYQQKVYDAWVADGRKFKAAAKSLGMSPERVRQVVAKVRRKMRDTCPHKWVANGFTSAGVQRYRCKICGASDTPGKTRRSNGDRLTAAEYKRISRAKNKKLKQGH